MRHRSMTRWHFAPRCATSNPWRKKPLPEGLVKPAPHPRRRKHTPVPEDLDVVMPLVSTSMDEAVAGGAVAGADALTFQRPGVRTQVVRRLRRGLIPIEDELDLHGLSQTAARDRLADFLTFNREAGAPLCADHPRQGVSFRCPWPDIEDCRQPLAAPAPGRHGLHVGPAHRRRHRCRLRITARLNCPPPQRAYRARSPASNSTAALAAKPSPRPMNPKRSVVVALMLMR